VYQISQIGSFWLSYSISRPLNRVTFFETRCIVYFSTNHTVKLLLYVACQKHWRLLYVCLSHAIHAPRLLRPVYTTGRHQAVLRSIHLSRAPRPGPHRKPHAGSRTQTRGQRGQADAYRVGAIGAIPCTTSVVSGNNITGVTQINNHGLKLAIMHWYCTLRDAILTCARKPTWVSLIYRTEPITKKCKNRKKLKLENRYAQMLQKRCV